MTTNPEYYKELVVDEISDNIEPAKKSALYRWLSRSPDELHYYTSLRDVWVLSGFIKDKKKFDGDKAFSLFQRKVGRKKKWNKLAKTAVAACFALLISGSVFTFKYFALLSDRSTIMAPSVIEVPPGSKTQTTLSDGTVVWLNSGTTLHVMPDFRDGSRKVRLEGEGYFKVVSDPVNPFVVDLDGFSVRVHGTTFNIKSFANDREKKVSLVEGEISVELENGRVYMMKPDDLMVLSGNSAMTISSQVSNKAASWMEDMLCFQADEFHDILNDLERKFGVEFRIDNPYIGSRRITGEFSKYETIDGVIEVLSRIGNFRYHINGNQIRIL